MLPSNLRITNEDTNYVSQTQKFQFDFPSNEYEEDDLNLGGAGYLKYLIIYMRMFIPMTVKTWTLILTQ